MFDNGYANYVVIDYAELSALAHPETSKLNTSPFSITHLGAKWAN
ncbi:hypothetical protein IMCC3088_661 [Aequoribacter fuscus]|uniref:Uncharacterized protein n=1 Tax=Aequoribacter fuscus TaxID=2518989 RepID=F3L624_9GAMM|nr:hypothetical protein IMCC3088_661 [Aequoribacter fuscus]